ncbi:MAG: hypothetical protein GSR79_07140 [Desulfurococcales archaeon]|nr:hypothetical protein [Desulfurococcales archaeon]
MQSVIRELTYACRTPLISAYPDFTSTAQQSPLSSLASMSTSPISLPFLSIFRFVSSIVKPLDSSSFIAVLMLAFSLL